METKLNILEQAIISEIIKFNEEQYPFIKDHFFYLIVKSRENTGVGMYINFDYLPVINSLISFEEDIILSSNKGLEIDVLEYGLNYELNITKGKIDFLELVTNGEFWDGSFSKFRFE